MSARHEAADERPAKRQRTQSSEVEKSTDFWFKSGDFVMIASQKVAYRVHGDVLGRKSKVFNDLLNLHEVPRPDCEDEIDGCPVVHVTDSPDDFNTFLCLIYDGFEQNHQHAKKPRWTTVRVMILFGDKYDVPLLREEGTTQLRSWYSRDIDQWDKRDPTFFAHEADHLSVAGVTRILNDPDLHAAVMYQCCRLPVSWLFSGNPVTGCPALCTEDLVRIFRLQKALPTVWLKILHDFVVSVVIGKLKLSNCATPGCRPFKHEMMRLWADEYGREGLDQSLAYQSLDDRSWMEFLSVLRVQLCQKCISRCESLLHQLRQGQRDLLSEHLVKPSH